MAERLPRCTGAELLRALKRAGWIELRRKGSHLMLRHASSNARLVVPVHPGRTVKRGTLQGILEDAGLTGEDLRKLL